MAVSPDITWLCPGRRVQLSYTPPTDVMLEDASEPEAVKKDTGEEAATLLGTSEAELSLQKASGDAKEQSCSNQASQHQARASVQMKAKGKEEQGGCHEAFERTSVLAGLPKYTALTVDATPLADGRPFKHLCAVFIIPQGMELDWLVSTPEGQAQVVAGADSARDFLVTLNRGHTFESAESVQRELSPWIRKFVPSHGIPASVQPGPIPYTTPPQGIGHRTVLNESWSELNGPIIVEDVRLVEPGKAEPTTFRRMVFLDTPSLIQSEAVLVSTQQKPISSSKLMDDKDHEAFQEPLTAKKRALTASREDLQSIADSCKTRLGNSRTDNRKKARRRDEEDPQTAEGLVDVRTISSSSIDFSYLASDYLQAMVAGIALLGSALEKLKVNEELLTACNESEARPEDGKLSKRRSESDSASEGLEKNGKVLETRNESGGLADCHGKCRELSEGGNESGDVSGSCDGSEQLSEGQNESREKAKDGCSARGLNQSGEILGARNESGKLLDVVVIGLGGGGLPMFLRHHLPCRVQVVEIDPVVVQLAKTYFGVSEDPAFQIHVADAIQWVGAARELSSSKSHRGSYDAVLIDVEAAGGECPPRAFLDSAFLKSLRELLRPGGVLAMNVVAPEARRETVYGAVQQAFNGRLYEWSVPRDNNHVLFAQRVLKAEKYFNRPSALRTSQMPPPARLNGQDASSIRKYGWQKPSDTERAKTDGDKEEEECDLVYWASRLAELGAKMSPWGQGPDLPGLATDFQPVYQQSCD